MAFLLASLIEPSQVVLGGGKAARGKKLYMWRKKFWCTQGENNKGKCGGWWERKQVIVK